MYRYAQIDDQGRVISDSKFTEEFIADDMISIDLDFDLTDKKYNLETKEWENCEPLNVTPLPTLEDKVAELQDNQLVMMDAVATSYEKESEISDNQLMIMDAIATLFETQVQ